MTLPPQVRAMVRQLIANAKEIEALSVAKVYFDINNKRVKLRADTLLAIERVAADTPIDVNVS